MKGRIALTGGIACGKSLFAQYLGELGAATRDADDVVHELESAGGAAVAPIVARFGEGVLAADGGIDRRVLAGIVFADPVARADLEAILFPRVREALAAWEGGATEGVLRVAVIPLLFESHWDSDYDIIIALVSPAELQIRRMMETRGYSRIAAEARLKAQLPVAEKAARADHVVVNDSTPEALREKAIALLRLLRG